MKSGFNIPIISRFLATLLLINGAAMCAASLIDLWHQEQVFQPMCSVGVICMMVGIAFLFKFREATKILNKRDGYIIVSFGWLILTLSGALPYLACAPYLSDLASAENTLSITNSVFESISGYTTTGSTILNDIESMPKALLFWRSMTQWIGGMGIIVLTIAILPLLGIGGMQLFLAEAPGISADKLNPRITDTAKRLWIIYLSLTALLIMLLWIAGMSPYDAANHAFTTISTGGFSTKNSSVAFWNHVPLIQYIICLFMFIAGTNFVLTYYAIKGKFKKLYSDEEFRYYLGIVMITTVIIALVVYFHADPTLSSIDHGKDLRNAHQYSAESSIRHALLQVLTIITTTGYISADYTFWPAFVALLIFSLFFLGGMAGSTSGGVKVVRHIVLMKNSYNEFKKMMHPNAIVPLRLNGKPVSQEIINKVLAFFMIYLLTFVIGSIVMGMMYINVDSTDTKILSAITVTASSLGNVGPAFGEFGPVNNYNGLTEMGKWFSAFLMILGRLELFTVLILFTPAFWKR